MIFVAVTGSIGCGKTTISDLLREQGFLVYDIDKWVKYLYYKRNFLSVIKTHFSQVFDGDIFNKRKLRELVFDNSKKLKELESLIHPYLEKRLRKIIRTNKNKGIVFCDIALLFEMGWNKYFDYVILADVDKEQQKKRVMIRDNISEEDFYKIDNIQLSMNMKREKVDFIVNTGISLKKLRKNIIDVVRYIDDTEC